MPIGSASSPAFSESLRKPHASPQPLVHRYSLDLGALLQRGANMPIRPFLSGRAFDPETIDVMSEALKGACETLSLKLVDGPETRLVAQKIIALAQRGVRDVATLQAMALREFKYE